MNLGDVHEWIRARVDPVGPIEVAHDRPWATVLRVPLADRVVWCKVCAPSQTFEPRLTADLSARWPDLAPEVLDHDSGASLLLLADAGRRIGESGNPPERWLELLPPYAELQRGETTRAADHLAHGVPDLRTTSLPARFEDLLRGDLPISDDETRQLREVARSFPGRCEELAAQGIEDTVQHDDLHMNNVFAVGQRLRILDWGDASIAHPFASLIVTFRFLEQVHQLPATDAWFGRLRDAYLEPWGRGLQSTFALATYVGTFAHAIARVRQRDALPRERRTEFDDDFMVVLRRALTQPTPR